MLQQPSTLRRTSLIFYTQVVLGFAVSKDEDIDPFIKALQGRTKALAAQSLPRTGNVVLQGTNKYSSGTCSVVADPDFEIVQLKD